MEYPIKRFAYVCIVLLAFGLFIACGDNETPSADVAEETAAPEAAETAANTFENSFFKADIPAGWTVFDDSKVKMMRIYPEKDTSIFAPTIHFKFEGSGKWGSTPEQAIKEMAGNYEGSAPEKEIINGVEYWKTMYEYGGQKQTMYVAKKDGTKITVTVVGRDYEKLPEIMKTLSTVSYK